MQEGSMRLITRVDGIYLPVAVCPLVSTFTSIGNDGTPVVVDKHN